MLLGAIAPRLVLLIVWLSTDYVSQAFDAFIVPLVGLIFLPFTTLAYVVFYDPATGMSGWGWFWVIVALLVDLSQYGGGGYSSRRHDVSRG